jgi:hypothetical protein
MLAEDDPLILDLVEWVARDERSHADLMESWRTSCPRLTVWEDAVDRGYVARDGQLVTVTRRGHELLAERRPSFLSPLAGEGGPEGRMRGRTPLSSYGTHQARRL